MNAFKIEDGIAPPERREGVKRTSGPGRPMEYPWPEMQVGQSVFIPGYGIARGSLGHWKKQNPGWKAVTKTVVEEGVHGTRIWRTA